jgi:hypothetical protein
MSTDLVIEAGVLEGICGLGIELRCILCIADEEAEESDERENCERRREDLLERYGESTSHPMLVEIMPLSPRTEVGDVGPVFRGGNGLWKVDWFGEVGAVVKGENGSVVIDELGDVCPEVNVLIDPLRTDALGEITELLLRSESSGGRSHDEACVWVLK